MAGELESGQTAFEALCTVFAGRPGVSLPGEGKGFGSSALRVNGSIFAMPTEAGIVFKLPASRVAELIAAGQGSSFDAGKGKPMREWVTVRGGDAQTLLVLAEEACEFVGASARRKANA